MNGMRQELKTVSLEFMKKNTDVTVENNGKFQKIAQYETGALFISPNGLYAVAIIDGKVKVGERPTAEDRKKQDYPDGWKWTGVFGQGKVTVNEAFTGTLYTNLCTIMSENGKLKIENNLITMFDKNEVLRFQAGDNGDTYLFALYNEQGKRTAYMDDNGNLTICGIFKTGEDGEARTIIDGNGIQSYDENGAADGFFANVSVNNPDVGVHEIALYKHGEDLFRIFKGSMGVHVSMDGSIFFICNGNTVRFANKTLIYDGSEVANKSDIENLQAQINALKGM